ncbi:hypothetical protein LMG26854_02358 [Achromobacter aegrifaciens]|nr:hypothetical protein LMG26854_02358 [Achromobacter aegrifaciens]
MNGSILFRMPLLRFYSWLDRADSCSIIAAAALYLYFSRHVRHAPRSTRYAARQHPGSRCPGTDGRADPASARREPRLARIVGGAGASRPSPTGTRSGAANVLVVDFRTGCGTGWMARPGETRRRAPDHGQTRRLCHVDCAVYAGDLRCAGAIGGVVEFAEYGGFRRHGCRPGAGASNVRTDFAYRTRNRSARTNAGYRACATADSRFGFRFAFGVGHSRIPT